MSGSSTARQKMLQFVNWKMRVTISDTREITGTFMAFDKHMNMILGDSEEYRLVKQQGKRGKDAYVEEKRLLGLLLLRGEAVISIKPVGPPAPAPKYKAPAGGAPAQAALPGTAGMAGMAGMIARPAAPRPAMPRPGMPVPGQPMPFPGQPGARPGMPMMMMRPPPGGMRPGMPMPPRPGMMPPHMMFGRGGPPGGFPGARPGMPPQGRGGPPQK